MKPIETIYKGFRFRSRIEARWATFYDSLGIEWEYEKEGYDLGNGILYLPDFYIPHLDCFIEIKGEYPGQKDQDKISILAQESKKNVYVFTGQIEIPYGEKYNPDKSFVYSCFVDNNIYCVSWDNEQHWCECRFCGFLGTEWSGMVNRLPCVCGSDSSRYSNYDSPLLLQSYYHAKQARFEYGK